VSTAESPDELLMKKSSPRAPVFPSNSRAGNRFCLSSAIGPPVTAPRSPFSPKWGPLNVEVPASPGLPGNALT